VNFPLYTQRVDGIKIFYLWDRKMIEMIGIINLHVGYGYHIGNKNQK